MAGRTALAAGKVSLRAIANNSKVPVRLGSVGFGWVRLNRYEPDGGSERFGSCAVRFAVPTGSAVHAGPVTRGSKGFGTFGA